MDTTETTAPRVMTRDVGLAIRDFIEGREFFTYADNEDTGDLVPDDGAEFEVVDCSDPDNLVVMLDNGQRFIVRVVAA